MNEPNAGAAPILYIGMTLGGQLRRALLQFDMSRIPYNATVSATQLSLTVVAEKRGPYSVHRCV